LTFQKELQNFVTNNVFFEQKVKTHLQQNKKSNIKPQPKIEPGTCHSQTLNPGPLAPKAGALPLNVRVK